MAGPSDDARSNLAHLAKSPSSCPKLRCRMPIHVIYARKSTESEDRQALSIDSQVKELRAIALRQGLNVAEVLSEARSAKAPGRPVFGDLVRRIRRGEIAGVLCWKMDRLARNHLDHGTILQLMAEGKLPRVVTSDRTYTGDGNDRFIGNFELGMATKYIDDLRANVNRGNRERLERGWLTHNPPLGYLLDPATKTIVKDPERFDQVRRMWDLLLSGTMRPDEIRKQANAAGFRTRKFKRVGGTPLSRATIYQILENPFYMGVIRLRDGRTYPGAHPAMLSREEFDDAQRILGRAMRPRPQKHSFPYVGLIQCGNCRGSITAEVHVKRSGRTYTYYRCSRRKKEMYCREPAVAAHELDRQLSALLDRVQMPGSIHELLQKEAETDLGRDAERRARTGATIAKALADTKSELNELLSLRLRKLLTDETYVAKESELKSRIMALESQTVRVQRSGHLLTADVQTVFDFSTRASETMRHGTGVQRRMILEAAGLNYTLTGGSIKLAWTEPLSEVAKAADCLDWSSLVDDVRTAIRDRGVSVERFRRALQAMDGIMPGVALAA